MACLDIFCSNPINLKNKIAKVEHKKNVLWLIKDFKKYFNQYMPKIFHHPHKNPSAFTPTYLI